MSSKIIVVTGSPRKNGNSFAMTDSFIRAAEEKGHEIVRYDAAFMNVGGCRACETCFSTGKPCSFDDDFNRFTFSFEQPVISSHILADYLYGCLPCCLFMRTKNLFKDFFRIITKERTIVELMEINLAKTQICFDDYRLIIFINCHIP